MPDQTPPTIGERIAFAHALYPYPEAFKLRDLDAFCQPPLGGGHCAQIIAGKIKEPRRATLRSIARVLGCSYAWLAEGEGRAPGKKAVREAVDMARSSAGALRRELASLKEAVAGGEAVGK